jgi:hypothetical protein
LRALLLKNRRRRLSRRRPSRARSRDQPKAPSRGPFSFPAGAGALMPIDPPFDANDAWWPNPGPRRNGSLGGPSYPDYLTDPFAPNPVTSVPSPFSAAQLGAMAWYPPIFPGDWSTFVPNNLPAAAWRPSRSRLHPRPSPISRPHRVGLTLNRSSRRSRNFPLQRHRDRSAILAAFFS